MTPPGAVDNGLRRTAIVSTASFLPATVVTNDDIIRQHGHGVTSMAVRKIYGVDTRHVAESGVADSDLLVEAARRALADAGKRADDLSKLIVTKFLGDRLLPMTASLTQRKLGTQVAFQAFDVDGGTNAFVQAIEAGMAAIGLGEELVLVASGGVHNRLISRSDPRHAFLYGDGAAAVLLGLASPEPGSPRIEAIAQATDTDAIDFARAFEMRKKAPFGLHVHKNYEPLFDLYEGGDWRSVQAKVLALVEHVTREVLSRAAVSLSEVDLVLFTENHQRLTQAIRDQLGVPADKTLSIIAECGNTMSAMLPLLLDRAIRLGKLRHGQRVLMISVGEGLSCGGILATY